MTEIKLSIPNRKGINLSARLHLPSDQHPKAFAIFAHCFACNKNFNAVRNIARMISMNGIGVLSFDFTGLGSSDGDFVDTGFMSNVNDLVDTAKYLGENYKSPQLLVGHSLGGAAVLSAAAILEDVQAVATIGSPADPAHVQHLFGNRLEEIASEGSATVKLGITSVQIGQQFLNDLQEQNVKAQIPQLRKAIMICHSPQDQIVGIDNAAEIYQHAHHPKSFVSLDQMDHMLSKKADSQYVGNLIANWASRYISKEEEVDLRTQSQVLVRLEGEGYTSEIKSGTHNLLADEPESVGGNDFGPSPYDLLSASLGACTAMTLKMYAERKKWDLQEVKVHLDHGKVHVDGVSEKGKIDLFQRSIEIEGNLDETQRKRLLEIADRCPVHRTLHNGVKVETTLK